jgi:phosphopantetheine adenylyltransferase
MVHPIVFSRGETSCPNVEVEKILLGNYILDKLETQCIFFKMEPEFSDMSSTKVREAFFKGNLKEVEYILPANVYNALNEEINKHR